MQKNKTLLKSEWNKSYVNKNNFLFYPDDEVIRFMSKYIRKRIGLNKFLNLNFQKNMKRSLDLGCGIGRHVIYCHEMGLDSYGIDLSDIAIKFAHDWAKVIGLLAPNKKIMQGDVRYLPWDNGFFNFASASLNFIPASFTTIAALFSWSSYMSTLLITIISGSESPFPEN